MSMIRKCVASGCKSWKHSRLPLNKLYESSVNVLSRERHVREALRISRQKAPSSRLQYRKGT
eukprot:942792-Prymnesium_polylepis.2